MAAPTAATIKNALVNSNYTQYDLPIPYLDANREAISLINSVGLHPGHAEDHRQQVGAGADAEGHKDLCSLISLELHERKDGHDSDPDREYNEGQNDTQLNCEAHRVVALVVLDEDYDCQLNNGYPHTNSEAHIPWIKGESCHN
jgi:hypothetical protein